MDSMSFLLDWINRQLLDGNIINKLFHIICDNRLVIDADYLALPTMAGHTFTLVDCWLYVCIGIQHH